MSLDKVPIFCVVCGGELPLERKRRRAITCSPEHAKERIQYMRAKKESRYCKYCFQPSTPELREEFKAWRRERNAKRRAEEKAARVLAEVVQ